MIVESAGNIVQAEAEAIVNTVNCEGFMGKGIALQFKQAWPKNFVAYAKACRVGEVRPGTMFIYETGLLVNPKYIVNFPTKRHWREKSRIEDIRSGLQALVEDVKRLGIESIAIPPLGCGYGGLNWEDVGPMIRRAFEEVPSVTVLLFSPQGAPLAVDMPIRTSRPNMTPGRALVIELMEQYGALDYRRTLLEIQKLAYFQQEAGEPLRLRYQAAPFGPFAANLNNVLEQMEGHFIRGYGDSQKQDTEIFLLPGAVDAAEQALAALPDSLARLDRVRSLIEGFETPYGMELLSTVHWVANHGEPRSLTAEDSIIAVQNWNDRKRKIFQPKHITLAYRHLAELGWIVP